MDMDINIQIGMLILLCWIIWDFLKIYFIKQKEVQNKLRQVRKILPADITIESSIEEVIYHSMDQILNDNQVSQELQKEMKSQQIINSTIQEVKVYLTPFEKFFLFGVYPPRCQRDVELLNYKIQNWPIEIEATMVKYKEHIQKISIVVINEKIAEILQSQKIPTQVPDYLLILNGLKNRYPGINDRLAYLGFSIPSSPSPRDIKIKISQKIKDIENTLLHLDKKNESRWKEKMMEIEFLKFLRKEMGQSI